MSLIKGFIDSEHVGFYNIEFIPSTPEEWLRKKHRRGEEVGSRKKCRSIPRKANRHNQALNILIPTCSLMRAYTYIVVETTHAEPTNLHLRS